MLTNFARLTTYEKTIWSMDTWHQARNYSFINKFLSSGPNSIIQHVTELKKTEKGAKAVMTLIADLVEDGVAGDRTLEGNEEAMLSYDKVIRIDQLRHAVRHEGRMANQKSVVEFRGNARSALSYWLAERLDQMAFLTMAGISYTKRTNGATRVGSDLPFLEFAADVTAPSANRRLRWDNANSTLVPGAATTDVLAADKVSWKAIVALKAYAKDHYIRGVKEEGGEETFHLFLTPQAMASLKFDPDYLANLRSAGERGKGNSLFTGSATKVDGIYIHEFRHVPNTAGLASGSKFGASGTVNGVHALFCGAQALGMADLGTPYWDEEGFDYQNQQGISLGKMMGFVKPTFTSIYENTSTPEDFGLLVCYFAY